MLKFFNKLFKKELPYEPSNRLESLLLSAVDDEKLQQECERQFFHFKLFAIGNMSEEGKIQFFINKVDNLELIYVYTSLAALEFASHKLKRGLPYIEIDSLRLFKILASAKLGIILNAEMSITKVYLPNDVSRIFNSGSEQKVQIGIPARSPEHLLQALKQFIHDNKSEIRDIYFALKNVGDVFSYLVAVDYCDRGEPQSDSRLQTLAAIIEKIACDRPVDITLATEFHRQAFENGGMVSCK